jgi:membrane-associated phospholipid phosphatase
VALFQVPPTRLDLAVARQARRHATPALEKSAEFVSFAADEHLLLFLGAGAWLISRFGDRSDRERANYLALNVIASAVLPHVFKRVVDQQRPDRRVHGFRNGIPKSGNAYDAFPSGHAVHIGAIASATGRLFPRWRWLAWSAGLALASTRVVLLAHWLSDVLVGLAMGAALERGLARLFPPRHSG